MYSSSASSPYSCSRSTAHQLYERLRQAAFPERLMHDGHQRLIGMIGLAAALENNRVAGFQAEYGRVYGHGGTRFIYDADDTQGYAHLSDLQSVGTPPQPHHFADRIVQGGT